MVEALKAAALARQQRQAQNAETKPPEETKEPNPSTTEEVKLIQQNDDANMSGGEDDFDEDDWGNYGEEENEFGEVVAEATKQSAAESQLNQ